MDRIGFRDAEATIRRLDTATPLELQEAFVNFRTRFTQAQNLLSLAHRRAGETETPSSRTPTESAAVATALASGVGIIPSTGGLPVEHVTISVAAGGTPSPTGAAAAGTLSSNAATSTVPTRLVGHGAGGASRGERGAAAHRDRHVPIELLKKYNRNMQIIVNEASRRYEALSSVSCLAIPQRVWVVILGGIGAALPSTSIIAKYRGVSESSASAYSDAATLLGAAAAGLGAWVASREIARKENLAILSKLVDQRPTIEAGKTMLAALEETMTEISTLDVGRIDASTFRELCRKITTERNEYVQNMMVSTVR